MQIVGPTVEKITILNSNFQIQTVTGPPHDSTFAGSRTHDLLLPGHTLYQCTTTTSHKKMILARIFRVFSHSEKIIRAPYGNLSRTHFITDSGPVRPLRPSAAAQGSCQSSEREWPRRLGVVLTANEPWFGLTIDTDTKWQLWPLDSYWKGYLSVLQDSLKTKLLSSCT